MWTSYLDWSLADFSGYIAADELYDGPFCVLSIVDNHTFKRLLYQVLDQAPDHTDLTPFFQRFRMALRLRGLALRGGHHCNQPLMRRFGLPGTTRASFYFYNTTEEIDRMIEILREAAHFFA